MVLDVSFDDSATISGALNAAQIDAALSGESRRQWRGFHPAIGRWRRSFGLSGRDWCWSGRLNGRWGRSRSGRWSGRWSGGGFCWSSHICVCFEQLCHVFSSFSEDGQNAVHRSSCAFFYADMQQHAVLERLKLHRRLVGFDFCQDFTGFNRVTDFFVPLSDDTFCHGVAQLGHAYNFCHVRWNQSLTNG